MLVIKFGGSSVGSAERIVATAEIIEGLETEELVVVVSAMGGVTSSLINGARAAAVGQVDRYQTVQAELLARHLGTVDALLAGYTERTHVAEYIEERLHDYERLCRSIATLGELTMRGSDAVASIGEELSSRILAALLCVRGRRAQAVSATTLIQTDDAFGAATPDMTATQQRTRQRLTPLLRQEILPIVTGYVGATPEGVTTTLGRGGSDYSAAILGSVLDAREVWVWSDVDGILTADPKLVPEARTLRELSYQEATELAYFGVDVLHPKTLAPLEARGVPLRILNSFAPQRPGTLISSELSAVRDIAPAIISTEGLSLIGVLGNGSDWSLDMASRALRALSEAGVDVLMFSQSFCERCLNLVVREQDQAHSVRSLQNAFDHDLRLGLLSRIGAQQEVASISVVGLPNASAGAIASQAFSALGELGLRIIAVAQAASSNSVSFVIAERDVARAVPFIHDRLELLR